MVSDSELGSDSGDDAKRSVPTKNRPKSSLDKNNIDEYLKDDSDVYEPENDTDEEDDDDDFDEDVVQGKQIHFNSCFSNKVLSKSVFPSLFWSAAPLHSIEEAGLIAITIKVS